MSEESPKLFVSYSWSSPEREEWVLNLATALRDNGVDVILDKWDLKEGQDAHAFMEKMVTDPKISKVAIVCDHLYAEKADGRSGGVGKETQIISAEVYEKQDQNKFVAIVVEKDEMGKPFLPTYYRSRIYIDLSDNDLYAKNFEQLLRWVFDKPLYIKPELGKKPAFLSDTAPITLGTTSTFRRALDAIRNNKDYCRGSLRDYFDALAISLERFRIAPGDGEFDDKVVESIDKFIPYRNEAIEIFLALAQYRDTSDSHQQLHRFFERLIPYMYRPEDVSSWRDWDFDNFRFIVHELLLYAIASLLRYECFAAVSYLLRQEYYVEKGHLESSINMVPFSVFHEYMKSLEHRISRLKLRRLSLRADLIEQRSKASGIAFRQIMQADFVLFVRNCFDVLRAGGSQRWWPETLLWERHGTPFEIFARGQSKEYFEKLKCLFDIKDKKDFEPLLQALKERRLRTPRWDFGSFDPAVWLGYEMLETRP